MNTIFKGFFKNCVAITCLFIILLLVPFLGKELIMKAYRFVDEKRYPEYYQAIAPIEAGRNAMIKWFIDRTYNLPDTVSNPKKYRNLLKKLWRDCESVYEWQIEKHKLQLKKYYRKEVDLEKLAREKPMEYLKYLWAFDSLAHDSLSREVFDWAYRPNYFDSLTYALIDSLTQEMIEGVFYDSATIEYIEAIIPDNQYIKLLKERQANLPNNF